MGSWEDEARETHPAADAELLPVVGVETQDRGLRVMLRDLTGFQHKCSMSAPQTSKAGGTDQGLRPIFQCH